MAATQQLASFVRATVDVAGTSREYFVYLPQGYDPQRAYPVVFLWHGAGGTGTRNNVPIQNSSGQNAILVGGTAQVNTAEMRTQWQFNSGANSPDVAFFDAMVAEVSARYCVDRGRLFSSGFSSGGWFTNLLGCVRGNVIRAQGVVAGGLPGQTSNCSGAVAAWFLHDTADMENLISGNERARARILGTNGCGTTTAADDPAPCVRYQGCRDGLPVVWCATTGAGHSVQSNISGPGMWRFFSSL
jgi:polyhydroxybutyrate depolymerase